MNIELQRLREALLAHARVLLPEWFPNGVFKGNEFLVGSLQGEPGESLKVNSATGPWCDFAGGPDARGKDLISLYQKKERLSYRDATRRLKKRLQSADSPAKPKAGPVGLLAVWPVPSDAPAPPISLGTRSPDRRSILRAVWPYMDASGCLLGYAVRFEQEQAPGGKTKKVVLPLFLFPNGIGWRFKGHGHEHDPMYGLDRLVGDPEKPVLMVEGEKTADAAGRLFPDYVAVTWMGGVNRLHRVDWSALSGRAVVYWRDADEPGRDSLELIIQMLKAAGVAELRIVELPPDLPPGWDLADEPPPGLEVRVLLAAAKVVDLDAVDALQDLDQAGLLERLVYVTRTNQFVDQVTGLRLDPQQVSALFAQRHGARLGTRLLSEAGLKKTIGYVYRPGDRDRIVAGPHKDRYFNLWRPSPVEPRPGDAGPFVEHLRNLCTTDEEFEVVANFLAFLVQRPGVKLMWALVIVGSQGTGKTALALFIIAIIGQHNARMVTTAEIKADFNEWLEATQLVVVEEIMTSQRLEIMNTLKPYITQQILTINVKYQRPYEIDNAANFIFLSNHKGALRLDKDDRRYFVIMSEAERKNSLYYKGLFAWAEANYGVILHWLLNRDLSEFNPNAPPPMTRGKRQMIDASRPELEAIIEDAINERAPPFEHDLVDLGEVVAILRDVAAGCPVSQYRVQETLLRLGAVKLGQRKAWIDGRDIRRSLWAIRDHERYSAMAPSDTVREYHRMHEDKRPF